MSFVIQGFISNLLLCAGVLLAFLITYFILLVYDSSVLSIEVRLSIFCHCSIFISDLKIFLLKDLYRSDSVTVFLLVFKKNSIRDYLYKGREMVCD